MSRHTTLVRCAIATSVLVLQLLSLDGLISQHRKPPESQGPDSPKKGDLEDRRGRGMPLDENQRQFLGKAIGLLARYPDFDANEEPQGLPEWAYSGPEDADLRKLAAAYRLGEIAGEGTELERLLNLMNWVHQRLGKGGGDK